MKDAIRAAGAATRWPYLWLWVTNYGRLERHNQRFWWVARHVLFAALGAFWYSSCFRR